MNLFLMPLGLKKSSFPFSSSAVKWGQAQSSSQGPIGSTTITLSRPTSSIMLATAAQAPPTPSSSGARSACARPPGSSVGAQKLTTSCTMSRSSATQRLLPRGSASWWTARAPALYPPGAPGYKTCPTICGERRMAVSAPGPWTSPCMSCSSSEWRSSTCSTTWTAWWRSSSSATSTPMPPRGRSTVRPVTSLPCRMPRYLAADCPLSLAASSLWSRMRDLKACCISGVKGAPWEWELSHGGRHCWEVRGILEDFLGRDTEPESGNLDWPPTCPVMWSLDFPVWCECWYWGWWCGRGSGGCPRKFLKLLSAPAL